MATANDIIPIALFRRLIQDPIKRGYETFATNGVTKVFQLSNYPVIETQPYSFTAGGSNVEVIDFDSGKLFYATAPADGTLVADYYYAQLTDIDIEFILDNALTQHDSLCTWDTIPIAYVPHVQMLALSSAYLTLATKWAAEPNVAVENVSISDSNISKMYLELGRQMLKNYQDVSAGVIDVRTVTRRDVFTGLLVPLLEGDV